MSTHITSKRSVPGTIRRVIITAVLCGLGATIMPAHAGARDIHFFSPERFVMNRNFLRNIPDRNRLGRDMEYFSVYFTASLEAFSENNLKKAVSELTEARGIWPEYYGTDFLIGLAYDREGRYSRAARFYKSYLAKLKGFYEGKYHISEPMIRALNVMGVESYGSSERLVREHLADHGIDLDKVKPALSVPPLVVFLVWILLFALAYIIAKHTVVPYLALKNRVKNPPEGFWVCAYCGTDNPVLRKECEICRRPGGPHGR